MLYRIDEKFVNPTVDGIVIMHVIAKNEDPGVQRIPENVVEGTASVRKLESPAGDDQFVPFVDLLEGGSIELACLTSIEDRNRSKFRSDGENF